MIPRLAALPNSNALVFLANPIEDGIEVRKRCRTSLATPDPAQMPDMTNKAMMANASAVMLKASRGECSGRLVTIACTTHHLAELHDRATSEAETAVWIGYIRIPAQKCCICDDYQAGKNKRAEGPQGSDVAEGQTDDNGCKSYRCRDVAEGLMERQDIIVAISIKPGDLGHLEPSDWERQTQLGPCSKDQVDDGRQPE